MASIHERRDGKHLVRWRDPDGAHRKKVFSVRRSAEKHKVEVEDCSERGVRWVSREGRNGPTLGDLMHAHLAWTKAMRSPRTFSNNGAAWRLLEHFVAATMNKTLDLVLVSKLTVDFLQGFYDWMRTTTSRHKRERKLDTIAKNVERLQNAWKWGANRDDFAGKIPPPRSLDDLPRDAQNEPDPPTWAEMDSAIACVDDGEDGRLRSWSAMPMAVMRALGLRVSQVLLLKVGDIRFVDDGAELVFRGELGKSRQERRGRIVPIAPAMLPLFRALTKDRGADEWLIPARRDGGNRARELRTESVREAWKRAGVRVEAWARRPDHCFRKGFDTGLSELGADGKAVEYLLGHSLGLARVYRGRRGFKLKDAVAPMPPFSAEAWATIEKALAEVAP